MSHEKALREEITRVSEIFALHFWEKVVDIINNILSSESLPLQYVWDMSPKDVVVNLVKILLGGDNLIVSSRDDGYIDVKFDAYIQLEGAVRWGKGDGFPLILHVTHEWLLREGKTWWECWVSHIQVKRWHILSSTGKGWLVTTPELSLIGPLGDNALPLSMVGKEHLDTRTLHFIIRTILVLSSSKAVDLRRFVFNITQCVFRDFHRLLHTVWELPKAKRHKKLYAHIWNVNVPKKPKYEWLRLTLMDSKVGDLSGYIDNYKVKFQDIKLHVDFLNEKKEFLARGVVELDAEINVELGSLVKSVTFTVAVNYESYGHYGEKITFTLLRFNDFREVPMMGYVDLFQYHDFIEAIGDGLREIFDYMS